MNDESMIKDLIVNFRWYQKAPNVAKKHINNQTLYHMEGPMRKWEGEIYSEIINNPRLISEKIYLLYPEYFPKQGTWEKPEKILSNLPKFIKRRLSFIDEDLYINNISKKILEPIYEDVETNYDDHSEKNDIISNLNEIQSMLRGTIAAINNKKMLDISNGLWNLSDLLLRINNEILSDESKYRLNIIKGYYENYYRIPSGPILTLKPIGNNKAAPKILEDIIYDEQLLSLIEERNKILQMKNLSKTILNRLYNNLNKYIKRNDKLDTMMGTSSLFIPHGEKIHKLHESIKNINLPDGYIPIMNLDNSRTYAMIMELKTMDPIYKFYNGTIHIQLNPFINMKNFWVLMTNTLSLREHMNIRYHEINKDIEIFTLDLSKPENISKF